MPDPFVFLAAARPPATMAALLAAAILPGRSEAKEELEDSDQDMDLVSLTNPVRATNSGSLI